MPGETFIGAPWRMPYSAQQLQDVIANQVPIIGDNGNWWAWDIETSSWEDTGRVAVGGYNPYIGDNGNWYIWDIATGEYIDTGITASTGFADGSVTTSKLADGSVTWDKLAPAARHRNPQLADNWYFLNPIDQRHGYIVPAGTAYYQFGIDNPPIAGTLTAPVKVDSFYSNNAPLFILNGVVYYSAIGSAVRGYTNVANTIDRWKLNGGTLTIDGGLRWTSGNVLYQVMDGINLADGIQRHISYMDDAGQLYDGLLKPGYVQYGDYSFSHSTGEALYVMSHGSERKIVAVKLEPGDHQTLAHQDADGNGVLNDPPPNKTLELLKCQRYFQTFATQAMRPTKGADFRPVMRTENPTLGTITLPDGTVLYTASSEM